MFKSFVRAVVRKAGYEVVGHPRAFAAQRSLRGLLEHQDINLVFDVGANEGQFVDELRASGYCERIVSFEPLAAAHSALTGRAKKDPAWVIADRTALGAHVGSIQINVSKNGVSSSILNMLPSHSEAAPQSTYVKTETVAINRLDDLCTLTPNDHLLLKVDVQGYEKAVFDGGAKVLDSCRCVIVELSLVPLYEGQVLAKDIWDFLASQGFEPWSFEPGIRHPDTGRMLQLDGIFVRANGASR